MEDTGLEDTGLRSWIPMNEISVPCLLERMQMNLTDVGDQFNGRLVIEEIVRWYLPTWSTEARARVE